MTRFFSFLILILAVIFTVSENRAQTRKAVSAAEVTGTFRSDFGGKSKQPSSKIQISALGKGKLKVRFDLVYPYVDGRGEMSANMGAAEGIAEIAGDTAVYSSQEFGNCKITIKFLKPGTIKVTQTGVDSECGFGFNVSAGGTYRKVSRAKPKF